MWAHSTQQISSLCSPFSSLTIWSLTPQLNAILHSYNPGTCSFFPPLSPATTSEINLNVSSLSSFPFLQALYSHPNTCFSQNTKPSSQWNSFLQHEGVTQGCSLSSTLACLGLHPVLQQCMPPGTHPLTAHLSQSSNQLAYTDK